MKKFTIEEFESSPLIKTKDRFLLQDGVFNDGSPSGTLHNSEEDAENYRKIVVKNLKQREETRKEIESQERRAAEKESNLISSYGGWLSDSPMKAGKQRKTMECMVRYKGRAMMRKEVIEEMVRDGRRIQEENRLEKGGTFYEMNKTEADYARFLISRLDS